MPEVDTKKRLLEVAAKRVHRQGFFMTSLDEIAGDAQIAKATIYHHFRNKDELGKALIEFNVDHYLKFLGQNIFLPELTGLQRIQRLCDFVVEETRNGRLEFGCPICNMVSELTAYSEEFRRRLDTYFVGYRKLIEEALQDAQQRGEISALSNPGDTACLVLAQLQGSILLARAAARQGNAEDSARLIERSCATLMQLLKNG